MADIVDDLKEVRTALEINGCIDNSRYMPTVSTIDRAIAEIVRLRSIAGPISNGPSFREVTEGVSRRSVETESSV